MKKVLLILVCTFVATVGFSQSKGSKSLKFNGGLELGVPVGDFGAGSSLILGGTVQADYNVASNIDLTLNTGYLYALGKSGGSGSGLIPILGGLKYHFDDKFYGSAQLGYSLWTFDGGSDGGFTYAPGVGYKINDQIDVLLKYQGISISGFNISFVGLRLGYSF